MFVFFKTILWQTLDAVWSWFKLIINTFGLDAETLVIGMLCFSLFIGYILSPYLRNPLSTREKDRIAVARYRRRRLLNSYYDWLGF